jgi:hypothetical protein
LVLILLLLALLGATSLSPSHSSSSGTATVASPAMRTLFTIDGKPVDARGEPTLRPGQVLQFTRPLRSFKLRRLECRNDTHTLKLDAQRRWRVPDLPEGAYALDGRGATFGFSYVVRVRNHAAPCPGP